MLLRFLKPTIIAILGLFITIGLGLWGWFALGLPEVRTALKEVPQTCSIADDNSTDPSITQWHRDALAAVEFPQGYNPPPLPTIRFTLLPLLVASGTVTFQTGNDASATLAVMLLADLYPLERSLKRHFQTIVFADLIELTLSDQEIGNEILARTYFGMKTVGFTCAALVRYQRDVKDLSLQQLATLIGIIRGPSYYDPVKSLQRGLNRRNSVLEIWVQRGLISLHEADKAKLEPLF
jgi:hypothetical protein